MANLKRNRLRWYLILGLVALVMIPLFGPTAFQKARSLFLGGPLVQETYRIADSASICQVSIRNGIDSVLLTKSKNGWLVNGMAANRNMVNALLSAVQSVDVYSPIPKMVDSVVNGLLRSQAATIVRFGNGSEELKELRFIYTDTLGLGTVAIANEYEAGAVVRTIDQGAKLIDLLNATPSFWVNNRLVTLSELDISEVSFTNYEHPDSSFTIKGGGVGFKVLDHNGEAKSRKVNLKAVSRYLNYLKRVTSISVAPKEAKQAAPLYTLTIATAKEKVRLDFIPIPPSSLLDITGQKARYDYDRLNILMNGTDLYTAYWCDVDLTIKSIGYFYE